MVVGTDGDLTVNNTSINGGMSQKNGGGLFNKGAVTMSNRTVSLASCGTMLTRSK